WDSNSALTSQLLTSLPLTHIHTHTHTHTHKHTHSLSHSHTHTYTTSPRTRIHTPLLTHTHTHTHTPSLTHSLTHTGIQGRDSTDADRPASTFLDVACQTNIRKVKSTRGYSPGEELTFH